MDIILNNIEELTTPVPGFVMKNESMATSESTVANEAMPRLNQWARANR